APGADQVGGDRLGHAGGVAETIDGEGGPVGVPDPALLGRPADRLDERRAIEVGQEVLADAQRLRRAAPQAVRQPAVARRAPPARTRSISGPGYTVRSETMTLKSPGSPAICRSASRNSPRVAPGSPASYSVNISSAWSTTTTGVNGSAAASIASILPRTAGSS